VTLTLLRFPDHLLAPRPGGLALPQRVVNGYTAVRYAEKSGK